MRAELFSKNVECLLRLSVEFVKEQVPFTNTAYILRPLVDDVEIGVCLDKAAGRSTNGRPHIGNEETAIRLSADLVCYRGEQRAVALLEFWLVRVGCILVFVRRIKD